MSVAVNLVEVFSSAQGEGPYVGASTVFVRLGECDLRCRYCDSPGTWKPAKQWRLERAPGSGEFEVSDNPAQIADVEAALERLDAAHQRFVSVTGGEPLLQPEAVRAIGEWVAPTRARLLLETHGLAVDGLEQVVASVDVVSMDWKSPRDAVPAAPDTKLDFASRHRRFLEIAKANCEVYVKLVVTCVDEVTAVEAVAAAIAGADPQIPLILQPVTPFAKVREAPGPERLLPLLARAEAHLAQVRLIPQTHRAYGAL